MVVQGDLTEIEADAIIHPTNGSFSLSGEVGSALSRAGGDEFVNAVQDLHKDHGDLEMAGGNCVQVIYLMV